MPKRRGDEWPGRLTLFGERWRVLLVPRAQLGGDYGEYHPEFRQIWVWRGLQGRSRWRVLLHEIMHIAFAKAHGEDGVTRDMEEHLIGALTTGVDVGLYEILNRNFGFGPAE